MWYNDGMMLMSRQVMPHAKAQRTPRATGTSVNGGALTWRYDVCQGPVTLAEFDHDCRMTRWYVRGVGVAEGIGDVVAEVDVSGESPKPHYYLYNHRGDVLVVLNPDGAANSTFRYDAFGNYYQMTGPFTPRYSFSTKEYLPAAGLYLYQYRAYDPIAGRWTQRDPIDYQDSINLYQFCMNNPVNAIDATGLITTVHPNKRVLFDIAKVNGDRQLMALIIELDLGDKRTLNDAVDAFKTAFKAGLDLGIFLAAPQEQAAAMALKYTGSKKQAELLLKLRQGKNVQQMAKDFGVDVLKDALIDLSFDAMKTSQEELKKQEAYMKQLRGEPLQKSRPDPQIKPQSNE